MKKKYRDAIIRGVKASDFPKVPVDFGYRDSKNFWYTRFSRALPELLPVRATTVDSVMYAAKRIDPDRPVHRGRLRQARQRPAHLPAERPEGLRRLGQGKPRHAHHGRAHGHHQRQESKGKGQMNISGLKGGRFG
jgi:hypothetical protein